MRKARFTEHQIIAVLKPVEAGRTVKDVCLCIIRRHWQRRRH
ncbi:transposase [Providencia stuartii]